MKIDKKKSVVKKINICSRRNLREHSFITGICSTIGAVYKRKIIYGSRNPGSFCTLRISFISVTSYSTLIP